MSDAIAPALTPEEWEHVKSNYPWLPQTDSPADVARRAKEFASDAAQEGKLHRAAALALYGQPFGFTWEDVAALSRCADDAERWCSSRMYDSDGHAAHERTRTILARLAALLPPEGT